MIRDRFPTRRQVCATLIWAATTSPLASAQKTSPGGAITARGRRATFSVDDPRPLESVTFTFSQEYGWPVTFEEAPLVHSRDIVDVTRNFSLGIRVFDPRGGKLEFSYDLNSDGGPPTNPEPALRAALQAYRETGLPGRYDLIAADGYFHIVPVARADEGGVFEPVRSPLDETVTIDGAGRFPEPVLKDLLHTVESLSGYRISIGRTPFLQGMQPRIEQHFQNAEARSVLRSLIKATGKRRIWYLMYHIGRNTYYLSVI